MKRILFSLILVFVGILAFPQSTTYKVFTVKGNVTATSLLKRGDVLDLQTQIHLEENSLIEIIDDKNKIYPYDKQGVCTVKQIVENRKGFFESIKLFAHRTSLGGANRPLLSENKNKGLEYIKFDFINPETDRPFKRKDSLTDYLPFYFRISNEDTTTIYCNIYISFENGEIAPYFYDFLLINPNEEVCFPQLPLCYVKSQNAKYELYISPVPISFEDLNHCNCLENPLLYYPNIKVLKKVSPIE
jgi:hypothetical protein